ncbi:MAG: outer membrane protein [Kiloniellales bacterium]
MIVRLARAALPLFAAFALLASGAPSLAGEGDDGFYVGIRAIGAPFAEMRSVKTQGFAGPANVENDTDQVAGPAAVIGWRFKRLPLRAEIEGGYRVRFDLDVRDQAPGGTVDYEIDVATAQLLFTAILEWRNRSSLTPFVGGSIGWARNTTETQRTVLSTQVQVNREQDQDNIAWGLMAGVDWRFAERWSAEIAYRFMNLGKVETARFATGEQISSDNYLSHDVLLSVFYRF